MITVALLGVYYFYQPPKTGGVKESKTEVEIFTPEIPSKTVKGSCMGNSLASPLNDRAWRCIIDEFISDPCFETDTGKVICDSFPNDSSKAVALDLEKALPERTNNTGGWRYYSKETPNNDNDYWILELENGYKCYAMTGTLPFINKQTFYYNCAGNGEAMYAGQVQASTPVFTTTIVSEKLSLEKNVDSSKFQDVKIYRVWK